MPHIIILSVYTGNATNISWNNAITYQYELRRSTLECESNRETKYYDLIADGPRSECSAAFGSISRLSECRVHLVQHQSLHQRSLSDLP